MNPAQAVRGAGGGVMSVVEVMAAQRARIGRVYRGWWIVLLCFCGQYVAQGSGGYIYLNGKIISTSTQDGQLQGKLVINGGFLNNLASKDEAKAFVYAFDSGAFPNVGVIQPRLGSVEEWQFMNHNNDEHPIHVHVNDFQVIAYHDPTTGLRTGPEKFGVDNINVPAPSMLERCSTRLSTPPSDVARFQTCICAAL